MKSKKRREIKFPATASITLDGGVRLDHCMGEWVFQNTQEGKCVDKDRIFATTAKTVDFVFFKDQPIVHAQLTIKDLEKAVRHAKRLHKEFKRKKKPINGCWIHLGNLSVFMTEKR